jgi:hypothetical protein
MSASAATVIKTAACLAEQERFVAANDWDLVAPVLVRMAAEEALCRWAGWIIEGEM